MLVIEHFRHRGLKRLYFRDDPSGINPSHLAKVRLHELRGNRRGVYAVSVSGNWRVVLSFSAGKARDVNLVDYH